MVRVCKNCHQEIALHEELHTTIACATPDRHYLSVHKPHVDCKSITKDTNLGAQNHVPVDELTQLAIDYLNNLPEEPLPPKGA